MSDDQVEAIIVNCRTLWNADESFVGGSIQVGPIANPIFVVTIKLFQSDGDLARQLDLAFKNKTSFHVPATFFKSSEQQQADWLRVAFEGETP